MKRLLWCLAVILGIGALVIANRMYQRHIDEKMAQAGYGPERQKREADIQRTLEQRRKQKDLEIEQQDLELMTAWCHEYYPLAGPETCAAKWVEAKKEAKKYFK